MHSWFIWSWRGWSSRWVRSSPNQQVSPSWLWVSPVLCSRPPRILYCRRFSRCRSIGRTSSCWSATLIPSSPSRPNKSRRTWRCVVGISRLRLISSTHATKPWNPSKWLSWIRRQPWIWLRTCERGGSSGRRLKIRSPKFRRIMITSIYLDHHCRNYPWFSRTYHNKKLYGMCTTTSNWRSMSSAKRIGYPTAARCTPSKNCSPLNWRAWSSISFRRRLAGRILSSSTCSNKLIYI